jgi:hypothetical protein
VACEVPYGQAGPTSIGLYPTNFYVQYLILIGHRTCILLEEFCLFLIDVNSAQNSNINVNHFRLLEVARYLQTLSVAIMNFRDALDQSLLHQGLSTEIRT